MNKRKIFLAAFFSILVAASTSATAWLLDPAIDKIFINRDRSLLLVIPIFIIIAFATKGVSLYIARVLMIKVAEEVKKQIQMDMLSSFIKADTEYIENKDVLKPEVVWNIEKGKSLSIDDLEKY